MGGVAASGGAWRSSREFLRDLAYAVRKREDHSFVGHFLAAKVAGGSDEKDTIWNQADNGGWEVFCRET